MENSDKLVEKEVGIAMEMLGELKEQTKRWFRAFLILVGVEVATIAGFIWYLYQYDFESTIEQNGVYTLIDSQGNVISSDITPEQVESIMEIISNGKDYPVNAVVVQPSTPVTFPTNCCGQFNGGGWENGCNGCVNR